MQDEFHQLAVSRQVDKVFSGGHFSICDIDKLARLLGISPNQRIYSQLSAYHCIDFAEMSDREKELLQKKVVECLRGDDVFNPARVLHELTDEGRDFTFTEDRYLCADQTKQKRLGVR